MLAISSQSCYQTSVINSLLLFTGTVNVALCIKRREGEIPPIHPPNNPACTLRLLIYFSCFYFFFFNQVATKSIVIFRSTEINLSSFPHVNCWTTESKTCILGSKATLCPRPNALIKIWIWPSGAAQWLLLRRGWVTCRKTNFTLEYCVYVSNKVIFLSGTGPRTL